MEAIIIAIICITGALILLVAYLALQKNKRIRAIQDSESKQNIISDLKEHQIQLNKNSIITILFNTDLTQLNKEIDSITEEIVFGGRHIEELTTKFGELTIKIDDLKRKSDQLIKRKEKLIRDIQFEITNFKSYLSNSQIYPKDYLFSANFLEGKILDLKETSVENLPDLIKKASNDLEKFQGDAKRFYSLYNKLKHILKNENFLSGNEKQDIYFLLQQGKLDEAESLLNKYEIQIVGTEKTNHKEY